MNQNQFEFQNRIVCEIHNCQIVMVNLNEKNVIKNRLACANCVQQNPFQQYKSLDFFENQMIQLKTQKLNYIDQKIEQIEQHGTQINNLMTNYGNIVNKQILTVQEKNQQQKQDWINKLQLQKSQNDHNFYNLSKEQIQLIANQLSNSKDMEQFNQIIDKEYQLFIEKSQTMLSDFIQQDQIRNLNLKESGYVRQNQLKKPKQLLFQIILPIILCFVLFNYYQLLNQPQLINQEINLNEINQDKVVNFNESSELLNQTQKDSEIQINQINQEKEQENDLEKKQYKEQENLKDNEIINNKHLNSNESDKIFNYQLINSIFYVDMCYAFAFNKEASIMITTNSKYINLYEFKDGQIQLIQTLQGHKDDVRTLYFMKNSNQFISGSDDNNIIIWEIKYNQWQIQQQLNGHTSSIVHIIMNNKEDLIISASEDGTIKFWEKQHNQWKLTQTISDFYIVFSLSLNESQNQLISSNDKSIIVMKQQGNDKKWVQIQKIELENKGFRLSFSGDNQFTFQPISGQYMNLYEWNNLTKQYVKIKDILVQSGDNYYDYWLFPQQFIMEKSILINKFGSVVNVIKKNQNGEFINLQSILFQDNLLYGSATDNGDYLVTWDYKSKEIQIRIYVEK